MHTRGRCSSYRGDLVSIESSETTNLTKRKTKTVKQGDSYSSAFQIIKTKAECSWNVLIKKNNVRDNVSDKGNLETFTFTRIVVECVASQVLQ